MERFKESLQMAVSTLIANAARSILSMLGIVIGIASVIVILALGSGAREEIMQQVNAMGGLGYTIYPTYDEKTQRMGVLEFQDVERMEKLPFVLSAFPQLDINREVRSRDASVRATVKAVSQNYLEAGNLKMIAGRDFSPLEIEGRSRVCLIGTELSEALFTNGEPVGKSVYVGDMPWEVIGVYSPQTIRGRPRRRRSMNLEMLAPLRALMRVEEARSIQSLDIRVRAGSSATAAKELAEAMERGDPKLRGLFLVIDQKEMAERRLQIQQTLSLIGALVAGISLLVGGIGMMNVMLTSVAERTREIGIRRAIGARKKDILSQFLVESCVLSGAGGCLGLLVGAVVAQIVPLFLKESARVAPHIQPGALVLAVGGGIFLGIVFGLYPAIRAARLSPAEALRSD